MSADSEVLLVCMPFGHVFSPSIALSLLKAELAREGMPARVRYYSIKFAEQIGQHFYYGLSAESRPSLEDLAGEWIFSRALFGSSARGEAYVEDILRKRCRWTTNDAPRPASPALIGRILRARERVDTFLQWCLEDVLAARPRLVGFTSMFQQHVASLALARLIKRSLPETFIVFGGANCEDVMGAETVRQFPFVDAAVSGEADLVFPELVRRVHEGRPVGGLPGVRTRDGVEAEFAGGRFTPGPMVRDLDALPYPDYADYFEQFEASRFGRDWQPSIYCETSRGCWWGERMHCTFCGLNDETMAFRRKSARRARAELDCLTRRHPGCPVEMTDNILDMAYFKDLVPELAARPLGPRLFYEVKANLKKEQLRMLRDAGVRRIQPGIESLSDPILKLMRKGVSALQNIQLLKWCKELDVEPGWNLLWGFPGEPAAEYDRMASLVPLLSHLPPPDGHGMIRLDRFSPNFYEAGRLGFEDVAPLPSYQHVYALPGEALQNLAYFFTFRYRERRDVAGYVARLEKGLQAWQRLRQRSDLFSVDTADGLLVWDLRPVSRALLTRLQGAERILYQACDAACDLRRLAECLDESGVEPLRPEAIARRLEPLVAGGLLVRDGPRHLALAVPLGEYSPPAPVVERFHDLVQAFGRRVGKRWAMPADAARQPARRLVDTLNGRARRPRAGRPRRWGRLAPPQFSVDRGEVLFGATFSR